MAAVAAIWCREMTGGSAASACSARRSIDWQPGQPIVDILDDAAVVVAVILSLIVPEFVRAAVGEADFSGGQVDGTVVWSAAAGGSSVGAG